MGFAFLSLYNPGDCPTTMENAQDQALWNEKFRQNQALFRKYTVVNGAFKNQIIKAVEPVFLSPLLYHLIVFGQVSALNMLKYLFLRYRTIDGINPEEKSVEMMGPYNPAEFITWLIEQLKKGRESERAGEETIDDYMMVSKGTTFL